MMQAKFSLTSSSRSVWILSLVVVVAIVAFALLLSASAGLTALPTSLTRQAAVAPSLAERLERAATADSLRLNALGDYYLGGKTLTCC